MLCLAVPASAAQTIESMAVFPPSPIAVGATVSLTVHASKPFDLTCGLKINFGDGRPPKIQAVGVQGKAPFPLTLETTYAKAGSFRIRADGVKVGKTPACAGATSFAVVIKAAKR
jgi:hypothetical protein